MIKVLFKKINYIKKLKEGINFVNIENIKYCRDIYLNLFEELLISFNDEELSESSIYRINNCLDFDINDKKNITYLYKNLDKEINLNFKNQLNNIINELSELIRESSINIGITYDYDDSISLDKLFQSLSIKYAEDDNFDINFITNILNLNNFYDFKLFITFNLETFFDKNEISVLNKEFLKQGIIILNISSIKNYKIDQELTPLFIDEDLCII